MIANKSIKELDHSAVELTITVKSETIEKEYKSALAKYAKTLQIKGFRKGKAPQSVVEAKLGQAVREESTFNVIEDALKEAIGGVEDKYKPLSYSTPQLLDEENLTPFEAEKDLTFSVKYDVMPNVELPAYKGLKISYPKVTLPKEAVDAEIEKLRQQNAMTIEKKGKAADGDIVTVDYVEVAEDGSEVEETKRADFVFTLGSGSNFYEIDKDIVGMAAGEEKTVEKTYGEDSDKAGLAGRTISLKIALKALKMRDVPELDDEFAQDVKEEYKTVADLVKGTKEKLQEALDAKLESEKYKALYAELLKNTTIALPETMVTMELEQAWKRYVRQTGLSEEQIVQLLSFQGQSKEDIIAPWREGAEESLKTQLILDKIKDEEKFEIDEEELKKLADEQLAGITDEEQRSYYVSMMEDDMRFSKTGPFLLENNTFTEGEKVEYTTFMDPSYGM
ncbi:MAG: trigger factor [Spirochaetales bacterium]|jgi:trigger factor|nr:trigger factor [Spirochaetales bacterium]HRV23792.1 trigger factor [Sphaerochaeta sp.]